MSKKVSGWPLIAPKEFPNELPAIGESDAGKVLTVDDGAAAWAAIPEELPDIAVADAGKVLTVNQAGTAAGWAAIPEELPDIAVADAGKVLTVNQAGTAAEWAAASGGGGAIKASVRGDMDAGTGTVTYGSCSHSGTELATAMDSGTFCYLVVNIYVSNELMAIIVATPASWQADGSGYMMNFTMYDAATSAMQVISVQANKSIFV